MKRVGKPIFFVVAIIIFAFTALSFFGISSTYGDKETIYVKGANNIRWGIDIRGGVDVTFTPPDDINPTEVQMNAATEVMRQRLVSLNITDYEVYTDTKKDRIIVRFPWKEGEVDFDPESAIKELGDTAVLTFREGYEIDSEGKMTGVTAEKVLVEGKNVEEAIARYGPTNDTGTNEHYVSLKLDSVGSKAFGEATALIAAQTGGTISIWMDEEMISNATVKNAITGGQAIISGNFTLESATALANKINAGALPFKLQTETYSTITPTLGMGARDAMVFSGLLAFILVCIYMIILYKLPGVIAAIALLGQVGGMIAATTGFFDGINSFTMTIPGIAGMILSIGMGVDANVITSERIKEEIRAGKSIDGAISNGYERGFSAIFDGNITVIIVAVILMGAFGAPSSLFAQIFNAIFFFFSPSTQGAIYSFGYMLLVGVILNFVCGVTASRLMLKSISKFKCFRNPKFYGGAK